MPWPSIEAARAAARAVAFPSPEATAEAGTAFAPVPGSLSDRLHRSPSRTEAVGIVSFSLVQTTAGASLCCGVPAIAAEPVGFVPAIETETPNADGRASAMSASVAVAAPAPKCATSWLARSAAVTGSESPATEPKTWEALKPPAVSFQVSPIVGVPWSMTSAAVKSIGVVPSPCVAVVVRVTVLAEWTICIRPLSGAPLRLKPAAFEIVRTTTPPVWSTWKLNGEPSRAPSPCATW